MKRIISLFLVVLMIISSIPFATLPVSAATSGTCGDNLTWALDDEGTLTISGTGLMYDFNTWSGNSAPWYESRSDIKAAIIEDGVTSIGSYAFHYCESLTSVSLPDSMTTIGDSAFYGCSSLTSINIPDSVTSIGDDTFQDCSSLTSINIPNGVTSIGYSAFFGCTSLNAVYITDIAAWCNIDFYNVSSNPLDYANNLYLNGELVIDLVIPDGVTSIGNRAFYECSSLVSVNIPDSVTSIGYSAFDGCSSLTSINIPDGVTNIGDWAFPGCSSLTSITIPDSVTSIGEYAFYGCHSLTSISIPDSVTSIGAYAFYCCCSLTSISIPDSVTSIGESAFCYCSSLTSISIPDGVTSIGEHAFYYCSSLTSISIPDGVTSIGDYVFRDCTSLNAVYITDIAAWCSIGFSGSYSNPLCYAKNLYLNGEVVTELVIPDSVTSIGNYAFYNCSSLISINIPDSVTSIGYMAFEHCSSLKSITIPDSVTSIGYSAFRDCSSLISINIPDSVTSIEDWAFEHCSSLANVVIPASVTNIGYYAFGYNYDLKHVVYTGSDSDWSEISIDSGNDCLTNSLIHYNATGNEVQESIIREISCVDFGEIDAYCGICDKNIYTTVVPRLSHKFTDGVCEMCGGFETDLIESEHPYPNNCDETKMIYREGAKWIKVMFSEDTQTESCDYIYIYDAHDNQIGSYSGTELAGKTIVVIGDTVKIRLTSDGSVAYYGYTVTSVKSYYEECTHPTVEVTEGREPTCTSNGFTGDKICTECLQVAERGATIPRVPHSFENDICTSCGTGVFEYYTDYKNETIITRCNANDKNVTVPETIDGKVISGIGMYAFSNDSIESITISKNIKSISSVAFADNFNIKAIIVVDDNPYFEDVDGVLYTKDRKTLMFYPPASDAESYSVLSGVTEIMYDSITNCSNLKVLTIPESVVTIPDTAIFVNPSLEEINVDAGNKKFKSQDGVLFTSDNVLVKFPDNSPLVDYEIPNGTTKISESAFYGAKKLRSVVIPSGTTSIENYAFENCSILAEITIPTSIVSIGGYAFGSCTSLITVKYEGTEAQWNNISLITWGNEYLEDANFVFNYKPYEFIETVSGVVLDKYHEDKTEVTVPSEYEGKPVVAIGENAFKGNENITSITIPESVTEIAEGAFDGCTSLEEIIYEGEMLPCPVESDELSEAANEGFSGNGRIEVGFEDSTDETVVLEFTAEKTGSHYMFTDGTSLDAVWVYGENGDLLDYADSLDGSGEIELHIDCVSGEAYYVVIRCINPGTTGARSVSAPAKVPTQFVINYTSDVCGDASADGRVTITDVLKIRKLIAGIEGEDNLSLLASDVNGDGRLTITDVLLIRKYIAGIITEFPAE